MDVRDFSLWATKARRRALWRRSEMYAAALLPNQRSESITRAMNELEMDIYAVDNEDALDQVETAAAKRLDEVRAKMRAKRKRRKK